MTRGVLFDLYGVVMRVQSAEAIAAIERAAGFGGPQLWEPFWSLRAPYDHGQQTGRQYWAAVAAAAGRSIADPDAVIAAEVAGWSRPDPEMVDYVRELARRCPVGVLSDVPMDVIEMLEHDQPWIAELPSATLSGRVGTGKPDPAVFRAAIDGLGWHPATCCSPTTGRACRGRPQARSEGGRLHRAGGAASGGGRPPGRRRRRRAHRPEW